MLRRMAVVGLATFGLALPGCEGNGRTSAPPANGPNAAPSPTTEPSAPGTPDRPEAPASRPSAAPLATSRFAEPELPEYLTILAPIRTDAPATARVLKCGDQRLAIETRNVHRLRIDRDRLPLNPRRSIALVLDGQSLEWLARSQVEEFERSPNGVWVPVNPVEPGKP
jgi:hypothetical protein